ncbi:centrosomal protein of 290 kDa-like [Arapaima gigas]
MLMEIRHMERTISSLEEEIVQQNKLHEEQQLSWDQREVELERQLDVYEKQHNEIVSTAQKLEEATGSVPDPSMPLAHQLDVALRKIKEHVRTILETQAACRTLEEKLKEKEAALLKAEQNILSRDKVINELRLRLPAVAEREILLADLARHDEDQENQVGLKVAHQTISNLQTRLTQKEEILKKYQNMLARARQDQEDITKKYEEKLRNLHQKLDLHNDLSLDKFKQTAVDLMKKPTITVPMTKHLVRLAELEHTVAEQDSSLSSLSDKLRATTAEMEQQRQIAAAKISSLISEKAKLEEIHGAQVKKLEQEAEELHSHMSQMEREVQYLRTELEVQKEANIRSPTNTMKNLVERLKAQLALKEKQQKALSKALLELRAEMTAHAEREIIASAVQKEESLNIQQIVDKHTKDLRGRVQDLQEELHTTKENLRAAKSRESSLREEVESLNKDLQRSQKSQSRLQNEKDRQDEEIEDLKKRIKRLISGLQSKTEAEGKGASMDELQKKIKRLEAELERRSGPEATEQKITREDKSAKVEILEKWEEGKKWQARTESLRNRLKDKEKETEALAKQLSTLKELYAKLDQEKVVLQKKLKGRGVTVDQVVGARTLESEREIDELKRRNVDLEQQILTIKQQQALPRDAAIEDMTLKNQYLEDRLLSLERQLPKEPPSRPSTSGRGSGTSSQREHELQKENLKLSAENLELRFQLEQANKDLPRLKDQVKDLKEMCEVLKKEKLDIERKLGNVRGSGRSGKTIPELEKTIGLMKKVVERVQRENESLKMGPGALAQDRVKALQLENEKIKSECEKLKAKMQDHLSSESMSKGMEKIFTENERLRKELKKVELLKQFPEEAWTNSDLQKELQSLSNFPKSLCHGAVMSCETFLGQDGLLDKDSAYKKMKAEIADLQSQLQQADSEKSELQNEVKKMKKELENFDPTFFEEIEDLKFNYNLEVKKNLLLEEQLKKVSEQFGVAVDIPTDLSVSQ